MGYCSFSSMSHDTMDCIVTQGAGACSRVATTPPEGLVTQPHDTANKGHDTVDLCAGARARARMAWPGVSRDTKIVLWLGATVCVAIWCSRPAMQRCDTAATCCDTTYDTAEGARCRSWVAIQFLYHGRRGARDTAACSRDTACDTTNARCDTPTTRLVRPTTWPSARCDMALCARPRRSVRSLGHGCVHCAVDLVLTQCTVLSHCLKHCSWTLFT